MQILEMQLFEVTGLWFLLAHLPRLSSAKMNLRQSTHLLPPLAPTMMLSLMSSPPSNSEVLIWLNFLQLNYKNQSGASWHMPPGNV